jgi:hypothetical protein
MKIDSLVNTGPVRITDPETGYSCWSIGGGSDSPVSAGTEAEPTETPSEPVAPEVQSKTSPAGEQGQGFLEPYLADLPSEQRTIVEPIMEKYRQEQDANVNKRFEQLQQETQTPVAIYQSLLDDPIRTLDWVADQFQQEYGLDIRSKLLEQWGAGQQSGQEPTEPQSGQETDKPLTQADIDRILSEREEQRAQQERQAQLSQQRATQQQQTINSWVDSAAKNHGLSLDDSQGEDPLRPVIIMQANSLHEKGIAKGQAAIEMATEAVAKRFRPAAPAPTGTQPKVAEGGMPPPAPGVDVTNTKDRRARMAELLSNPSH